MIRGRRGRPAGARETPPGPGPAGAALAVARRHAVLLGILAFGALFFAYRYWTDLQRPGAQTAAGWWAYNDQGFYLREATALGNLQGIPEAEFKYGPGYPALAAPFTRIGGGEGWPFRDPFLIPNATIWLLTIAATFLVARRLYGEWAGVAAALGLMLATPLIAYVTLPWNTTAVLGALMAVLLVALARRLRLWHGVVLGLAVALAYSSRYIDAIWVGIAVLAVLGARRALGPRAPALYGAAAGLVLGALPTLLLQQQTFGNPFTTAYSRAGGAGLESFAIDDIPVHAAESFVSAFHFGEGRSGVQPLLVAMFLVVLAPVGFAFALRGARDARRVLVLGFGVASLAATLVYWSYWFTGYYGLQFGSLHFFKPWFPLWTIAAVVAVVEGVAWLRGRALAP